LQPADCSGLAIKLNPLVEVHWIDAGHIMARAHPHEVPKL
jgi:hypothetical protein